MSTSKQIRDRIRELRSEYETLKAGKESLLEIITEAELPEAVYNSNAIENSTLTLEDTERILLEADAQVSASAREVFEAKNLGRVSAYMREHAPSKELNKEMLLLLHRMLITGIDDSIAGRFRGPHEYVRVGSHIAPAPEHVERMLETALLEYARDHESYDPDKIARFHLEFEHIHPFNDGNGRIGRVLMNWQLARIGFPPIIVRDKEKQDYYASFSAYREGNTKPMERVLTLALTESLYKRLAYLRGDTIVRLAKYAEDTKQNPAAVTNAARRQTIPAFREKGVWKIGV